MTDIELIVDFHRDAERQGPGSARATQTALSFIPPLNDENAEILDIGCGSGAQTITLAQHTRAHITAVDLFPPFLARLNERARSLGLAGRITTEAYSMDALPYKADRFDLIWSEGAVYNMGFEAGIKAWRTFLKPGGYLAVSELSWFTTSRPNELETYWRENYPSIDTISGKIGVLERNGYSPVAFFQLPEDCWTEEYYRPMLDRMPAFLKKHGHSQEAADFLENERAEIAFYNRYKDLYGYGFYIARKE